MSSMTKIVEWAAAECERQHSGETSVARMVAAYEIAAFQNWHKIGPSIWTIQKLASIVEPSKNKIGEFRKTDVVIGDKFAIPTSWREVPRIMEALVAAWNDLTADEWYRAFQEVHPFADGNGRIGAILWNAHRGTLTPAKLEVPPDFWKVAS